MLKAYKELEQRQSGQKTAAAWTQQMSQQTLSLGSSAPAPEPRSNIINSEFSKGTGGGYGFVTKQRSVRASIFI